MKLPLVLLAASALSTTQGPARAAGAETPPVPSLAAEALAKGNFEGARRLAARDASERDYIDAQCDLASGQYAAAARRVARLPATSPEALQLSWLVAHGTRAPQAISAAARALCAATPAPSRACADAELYGRVTAPPRAHLTSEPSTLPLSTTAPVPVVMATAGGVRTGIIVDTGASQSVVSASLAAKLHLDVTRASFPVGVAAASGVVDARLALLPELHVGEATVHQLPVLVLDMPELDAKGVSMILSPHQAFEGLVVTFDFRHNALRLASSDTAALEGDDATPYWIVGFDLAVHAQIEGREPALFALDTGLTWSYAVAPWYVAGMQADGATLVHGAGQSVSTQTLPSKPVTVGKRTLPPSSPAVLTNLARADGVKFAGLLGNGLWRGGTLTLDTLRRTVSILEAGGAGDDPPASPPNPTAQVSAP